MSVRYTRRQLSRVSHPEQIDELFFFLFLHSCWNGGRLSIADQIGKRAAPLPPGSRLLTLRAAGFMGQPDTTSLFLFTIQIDEHYAKASATSVCRTSPYKPVAIRQQDTKPTVCQLGFLHHSYSNHRGKVGDRWMICPPDPNGQD